MAYIAKNYASNPDAPLNQWTCAPGSSLGPFDKPPPAQSTDGPDYCGQCVSYVKRVCPALPVTSQWRRGAKVRGNNAVANGTVIATFDAAGGYTGHAAVYVKQDGTGITAFDQWVTGSPKAVGSRVLRWGAAGTSNNGDNFYVVE